MYGEGSGVVRLGGENLRLIRDEESFPEGLAYLVGVFFFFFFFFL